MPCYEVNLVAVDFKPENRELFNKALSSLEKSLGWTHLTVDNGGSERIRTSSGDITVDFVAGKATLSPQLQPQLNALKRAYSLEAIKLSAKLGGWQVSAKGDLKGQLLRGVM